MNATIEKLMNDHPKKVEFSAAEIKKAAVEKFIDNFKFLKNKLDDNLIDEYYKNYGKKGLLKEILLESRKEYYEHF
jgi:hypothetical protein